MKIFRWLFLLLLLTTEHVYAVDLTRCTIVASNDDDALVRKMAIVLSEDVERVSGVRPFVSEKRGNGPVVFLSTVNKLSSLCQGVNADELLGCWERYKIITQGDCLIIVGSDPRGLAYGVFHVSEQIGVSPWYWWADVMSTQAQGKSTKNYKENYLSQSPSVKYRGVFINDEDWGLKTWSARNFEKDLKDIGPKTYDKVCELLLRLKGNMLAPAMHSCTGAFYSHPESQRVAAEWGIMITTSHCEPMLINNAAKSEWDSDVDGEWNYLTNKETIWKKFDNRLRETAQYDNIYTLGMRGLHDAAMSGSKDPKVRAQTLEKVFADQREILKTHKQKPVDEIPQIFVPYKEALDIYDAGLRVPDDVTLVWPDDNYGYMKRVSNEQERQRTGGSGVYYHLSYLGAPHDYLWVHSTPPMLMYEELKKAYDAGAERYWLLNVGDIKPMELGVQLFFEMAWNLSDFNYDNVNRYQAQWLAHIFGKKYKGQFQQILDTYYRLAWQRKPEYMGYEMEWDSEENNRLHDTDFSFSTGTAQQRLADYQQISDAVDAISKELTDKTRPAFYELLEYMVKSAYQMNRKFLMAQRNHETGSAEAAKEVTDANDSIMVLLNQYNSQLNGKWNQMMSQLPPGFRAKYQLMPEVLSSPTESFQLPKDQLHPCLTHVVDLRKVKAKTPFRLLEGIGTDWISLQMGQPLDSVQNPTSLSSDHLDIVLPVAKDSIKVCISVVPLWPVCQSRSNRFGVSVDGGEPVVCENKFAEWSYPWKVQVLENRKEFVLTFPLDQTKKRHTLTLIIGDPGQIVQQITYE